MEDSKTSRPGETILPLSAETLDVAPRRAETARVRVRVATHERPVEIHETLTREDVTIARVAIGRRVDAAPPVRQEEGLTIIPVMQEVLLVERQLILKEEIHIQRTSSTQEHRAQVKLREQTVTVERENLQEEPSTNHDVGEIHTKEDLR